jgi:hypothetical protein
VPLGKVTPNGKSIVDFIDKTETNVSHQFKVNSIFKVSNWTRRNVY